MAVDVKDALLFYQRNPSLTEDDRAHIVRWLAVARDPIWQKIYAEFEANDEIPNIQGGLFCFVIGIALRYRAYAEKAKYETAKVRRRREQKREELCEKLLSLASDVEDVVERLRDYRKERRPPSESGNSPSVLKAKQAVRMARKRSKIPAPHGRATRLGLGRSHPNYRQSPKRWAREAPSFTRGGAVHQTDGQLNVPRLSRAAVRVRCQPDERCFSRWGRRGGGSPPKLQTPQDRYTRRPKIPQSTA
jgi:hypothetical protein